VQEEQGVMTLLALAMLAQLAVLLLLPCFTALHWLDLCQSIVQFGFQSR
jgi:hypothetical protein